MRSTILSGFGAMLLLGLLSHGGLAVTVNIDVVSKGEPVPSTEISFETADGSVVDLETPPNATTAELVSEDEPGSAPQPPSDSSTDRPTDASQTPATNEPAAPSEVPEVNKSQTSEAIAQDGSQGQTTASEEGTRPNIHTIAIPDEFVGKTLTIIIKKDGEVIKRQTLLIEPKEQQVPVEAYDAADAKISIAVTQAKSCRAGKACDLQLEAKNEGAGIYKGPLFLAALVPGGLSVVGKEADTLGCGLGSAGQHLCRAIVSLEPGETQRWAMRLSLPKKLARNVEGCVGVAMPDLGTEEGPGSVIQVVQLGLQQKDLLDGRADGRPGPKTKAAIAKFAGGAQEQPDFQKLYKAIYNQDLQDATRLGLGNARSCQALKITSEPVVKKAVAPSAKAKSVSGQNPEIQKKKQQAKSAKQQYDDDDDDGGFDAVGVGIGIGLGTGLGGGKDRLRKKKKYEDVPID